METVRTDHRSDRDLVVKLGQKPGRCVYREYLLILLFNCQDSILGPEIQPDGGVAQLGEHLPCKQGVKGSNPFISTIKDKTLRDGRTK